MGNYVSGLFFQEEKVYTMEMSEFETNSGMKNIYFYFGNIYGIQDKEISHRECEEDGRYNYHFHELEEED